uniref:Uncharacterized protein TCIL3000_11_2600 n=1 Tax=Trypanosoma congolense (strain IL3000) TaxID=1068625 RepID=G0UZP9_TRYCI|nr:unnamed protein product [Trypanosoma congolense IL3000]
MWDVHKEIHITEHHQAPLEHAHTHTGRQCRAFKHSLLLLHLTFPSVHDFVPNFFPFLNFVCLASSLSYFFGVRFGFVFKKKRVKLTPLASQQISTCFLACFPVVAFLNCSVVPFQEYPHHCQPKVGKKEMVDKKLPATRPLPRKREEDVRKKKGKRTYTDAPNMKKKRKKTYIPPHLQLKAAATHQEERCTEE